MNLFHIAAPLVAAVIALPAFAQTNTGRIDNREERQENRIKKGERSGAITSQEAERLRRGQDHVRDLENKAEADGKVTAEERARIERAQDRQSARINRQKTDDDRSAATGGSKP